MGQSWMNTCLFIVMMLSSMMRASRAFVLSSRTPCRGAVVSTSRWRSTRDGGIEVDQEGRRIRRRDGPSGPSSDVRDSSGSDYSGSDGWDDFDPFGDNGRGDRRATRNRASKPKFRSRGGKKYQKQQEKGAQDRKINLKALEGAGFVHLYGLASVLNALQADRRDFTRPEDLIDLDDLSENELHHEVMQRERKPQAQYSPWLFCYERISSSSRSNDKAMAAQQVEQLAAERNIPIAHVDKGVLNTLCENRPHQGYVLRCGKLLFEPISRIPSDKKLWLVLDEVVDPQNLGALLRSAYFLSDAQSLGVLVTAKNSAPPSPVVSAASAGALELLTVYSTSNLPRTLSQAREDGFRIVGAAAAPDSDSRYELDAEYHDLQDFVMDDIRPTLLVLGSEGHGLRNLVARACTDFVRIPAGGGQLDGVDSLNVGVTGGILLWHMLYGSRNS